MSTTTTAKTKAPAKTTRPSQAAGGARHTLDPSSWVAEYADYLKGYAFRTVMDHGIAEDLVQETFLSAWNARDRFRGDCAERTWLVGVLKNKIIDHFRKSSRRPLVMETDLSARSAEEGDRESWLANVSSDSDDTDPVKVADRAEFMEILEQSLNKIPELARKAFRMRELQGFSTEEITETLNISKSNLWVLIHRARQALKAQLETAWPNHDLPSAGSMAA